MKIDVDVSEVRHISGTKMSQCRVLVIFDREIDTMTITVVVPFQGGEVATRAQAIAAAKELARQFCDSTSA